jgi:hypothetical protein
MSSRPLDLLYTYQFLKRLATPFKEWDAFKLGIIDENGKVLRKSSTLKTVEEKNAWGNFDRLVANLKKLLGKLPLGKTRLASYAAALLLLKESNNKELERLDEEELSLAVNKLFEKVYYSLEEDIANVAGAGNIAGIGIGPQGEPPKKKKTLVIKNVIKRKAPVNV